MNSARPLIHPARILFAFAGLALSALGFSQNLLMSAHPVFQNMSGGRGVFPVEVELANMGADTRGAVTVTAGGSSITYPVELPQGTRKKLITYPDCSSYSGDAISVSLDTTRGRSRQMIQPNYGGAQIVVGEIAENGGDLEFLRQMRATQYGQQAQDVYVKPADAPDRPTGYGMLAGVILGDGAERLSDDAVTAIKTWALQGGTIIMIGGASAPVLNDTRWANVVPVRNAKPQNFETSPSLEALYGSSPPKFTAMIGQTDPAGFARAGGLIVERPMGLGRVVYLAFDPFDSSMLQWNSRTKLFSNLLNQAVVMMPQQVISSVQGLQNDQNSYGRYGYGGYSAPSFDGVNNPFETKLPSPGRVFMILALYFVAVVPINFIVLRKLKKGELAWATAPLLSLAFAGVFFASARGLYSAQLSTSTQGLLIVQDGEPNALIVGHTQMFFPHGGTYDLKMIQVDSIQSNQFDNPYRNPNSGNDDLNPIDNGEIHAAIDVPNLAFREVRYNQRTRIPQWFDIHRAPDGKISVTNNSNFRLLDARLDGGGGWVMIGELKPHSTIEAQFTKPNANSSDVPGQIGRLLNRSRSLALTGTMQGFRAGPQIGADVAGMSGLTIAYVSNVKLNENEASKETASPDFVD